MARKDEKTGAGPVAETPAKAGAAQGRETVAPKTMAADAAAAKPARRARRHWVEGRIEGRRSENRAETCAETCAEGRPKATAKAAAPAAETGLRRPNPPGAGGSEIRHPRYGGPGPGRRRSDTRTGTRRKTATKAKPAPGPSGGMDAADAAAPGRGASVRLPHPVVPNLRKTPVDTLAPALAR